MCRIYGQFQRVLFESVPRLNQSRGGKLPPISSQTHAFNSGVCGRCKIQILFNNARRRQWDYRRLAASGRIIYLLVFSCVRMENRSGQSPKGPMRPPHPEPPPSDRFRRQSSRVDSFPSKHRTKRKQIRVCRAWNPKCVCAPRSLSLLHRLQQLWGMERTRARVFLCLCRKCRSGSHTFLSVLLLQPSRRPAPTVAAKGSKKWLHADDIKIIARALVSARAVGRARRPARSRSGAILRRPCTPPLASRRQPKWPLQAAMNGARDNLISPRVLCAV